MVGIILTAVGTFFEEISSSFGKWEISHKRENLYTFGFLNMFWVLIIFIVIALVRNDFVFNFASIPFIVVFLILEMAQTYSSLHAVAEADRSTFGFLMIGTIPLLLVVDMMLGYDIGIYSVLGVSIIVLGILVLLINHGISKKGIGYVIFSTVNAVATISLYKYCITNFNSVDAQLIVTTVFILTFLIIMSKARFNENPLRFLLKKEFLIHAFSNGIGIVILNFSYLFAPASIITSSKRAFSLIWCVISGNRYFHEKHIIIKIISFSLIIIGLVFLVL